MIFNKRQLRMLVLFQSEKGYITSERFSKILKSNKRTIQNDIKVITDSLGKDIVLNVSRNGYKLEYLSDQAKTIILESLQKRRLYSSMDFKPSIILVYLLFQKEYTSMQSLADVFYMSKTSISNEIRVIKKWLARNNKVNFDVSIQKGMKIICSENVKREYLALIASELVLESSNLDKAIIAECIYLADKTLNSLRKSLEAFNFTISGEDLVRFSRFIAYGIVRERLGYSIEDVIYEVDTPMRKVIQKLSENVEYNFSKNELCNILRKSTELTYLFDYYKNNDFVEKRISIFCKEISEVISCNIYRELIENKMFINHIRRTLNRNNSQSRILNHYANETAKEYLLEVWLAKRMLGQYLNIKPSLAEAAFIALYLAEIFQTKKNIIKILLVSDQPYSLVNSFMNSLKRIIWQYEIQIEVVPRYKFEELRNFQYDMYITTEQDIIFMDERFMYIPVLQTVEEKAEAFMKLNEKCEEYIDSRNKKILTTYYREEDMARFDSKNLKVDDRKLFFIEKGKLVICNISNQGENEIVRYKCLDDKITFKKQVLNQILVINFNYSNRTDIFDFFEATKILIA